MARFNNFNRILSQTSNNDDDDEEEDEEGTTDDIENGKSRSSSETWDEDDDPEDENRSSILDKEEPSITNSPNGGVTIQKVDVKEPEDLKCEYSDNQFWKVDKELDEADVDALLAELDD